MQAEDHDRKGRLTGSSAASTALIRKLSNFQNLSFADLQILAALPGATRRFAARQDIAKEDDPPRGTALILSGMACRLKVLPDGRRQILGWLVPGDFCDLHVMLLDRRDHTLTTLTATTVAVLSDADVTGVMDAYPRIARAFWLAALTDEAIARECILSLGRRNAYERIAHLFCELYTRLAAVDLAADGRCAFPITQVDLADALGLSQVHVNRTLQTLRDDGLIELRGRTLKIPSFVALQAVAMFDDGYLHLRPSTVSRGHGET